MSMKMVRVALLVVLLSLASGAPLAAPPPGEYQIKAAYLLNFARYVEWPAARLAAAQALRVCLNEIYH